jgi:dipeptidyl aminopeptidase/acylaminoacyl peptidase
MTNSIFLRSAAPLAALLFVSAPGQAQDNATVPTTPNGPQAMTAEDLATFARVGQHAVSPDGRWVVFQQTDTDAASYARSTGLWLVDGNSAAPTPIRIANMDSANESAPEFSGDGRRLYFVSNKSGSDQLWFVDLTATANAMTAGEPVQASMGLADVAGFRLSPTGRNVVMWGDIAQDCPVFGCEGNGDRSAQGPGSGRVYDEQFVRHWDQWETPGVYSRAFTLTIGGDGRATTPVAVGAELTGDTPSKPFGGAEEIAWSPDGQTVYFTLRIADRDEPRSTNLDIYSHPLGEGPEGIASATNLTAENRATDTMPTPSPDGRWLAYAAMARPGYEADRQVVMLRDLRRGTVRALTQGWDRSVASIAWAPDSRSLIVTAQDGLEHPAFRVALRDGSVTRLTDRGNVTNPVVSRSGAITYAINSITSPTDLVRIDARGTTARLTQVNAARLAGIAPVHYEQFSFAGANGERVSGQIVTPMGASGRIPTVLLIHGGPQGSFYNSWSTRWNPMLFASGGFAAVTIDFHGSTGYGQAFTDSINRDWGGKPLEDLRLGFAEAGRINAQVDTGNACAAGGSYGGYMTNWIAGQWPDGFKCLVTHAGIFDLRAMALTTEELWFDEWDHGGPWWSRPDAERWNPVNHMTSWRTPTLVIQGALDYRVPYTQSLAAFTALQRQGIPSRLVMYPDENHWILRGRNSVQWYREVFGWMRTWTDTERDDQPVRWPAPVAQP